MSHSEMITNRFGEEYLYAVNRDLFEREKAEERIEREFGSLLAREDSLVIFIGSDSGNIIRYILERELPPGSRYLFIEPEDIYPQVAAAVDLDNVTDRVWLITPDQFGDTMQSADIVSYLYVDGVFVRRSLSAEYGFIPRYRSYYWEVESEINDLRWNTGVSLGQDAFIQRQLQNCADNQQPLSEIKGILEGKTVIVLGGGPSLDDHLPWIKAHRQQLVVFAVSRISARLQQVELAPDFVFSVDPQDISYQVSKEMLNFGPEVVFVNQYHVVPRLLAQWPHRKFFMGRRLPWDSDLNPDDVFNGPGPTVTNSAIAAAAWLGSKEILLAGVDLCFTPEGYTHAQGSKERAAGPKTDLSSLSVVTNNGQTASTTPDYASAARNIGLQAQALHQKDVTLVNLSPGAAYIDHVVYRPTAEIRLENAATSLTWPQSRDHSHRDYLQRLKEELESRQQELEELQELLQQASELHSLMYEEEAVNPRLKEELEQLDRRLAEDYPELLRLVKTLAVRGLIRMAQSFRALEELELADIKGKLDIYYGGLLSGAKRFGGHLSAALDSVDVRLEEYSLDKMASKEMAELCRRWGARLEPGRARFFADDVARREAFSVALDAYAKEMERDQLAELTRQNKLKNLHALPFRIQHLQDMGDVAALEVLQQALSEDPEASAYQPLISATICKLRQEPEAALQALLPVLEQPESPVLEQSFAMMVGLCTELGQYQAVMDAMAGLASLNAYYLNFYADALAANGQIGDAIEHLTEYLHYFPRDKQAVIKLMSWYEEQDNKEGVGLAQTLLKQLMQEE